MRFSAIALAAAVPAFVSAATLTIRVGDNSSLAYDPPSMTASPGDNIMFIFAAKNHSVTQSTFANPCVRSSINGTDGFTSGFNSVTADSAQLPSFSINVTQTDPIWFHCGQTNPVNHCQMGMVGVINPTANKTLDMFKAAAMSNSSSTTPTGTGTATGAAPSKTNGAMRLSSGAAGLLTLAGLVAGVAL